MNAAQALDFREAKSSPFIESLLSNFRQEVSFVEDDRLLHSDIIASINFIKNIEIDTQLLYL